MAGRKAAVQSPVKKSKPLTKRWWLKVIGSMLLVFAGVSWAMNYYFARDEVHGISMASTFAPGDRLLTAKRARLYRGAVVVLQAPDRPGRLYLKRLIGLPGDRVAAHDDQLYVNDRPVKEPYLGLAAGYHHGFFTENFNLRQQCGCGRVPANYYFVLGDNRPVSKDSRLIGVIPRSHILGVVKCRYWPLAQLRFF